MTKQNRETAYKHFRDLETNYTALSHLDKGMTSTVNLRARAKANAEALLLRNPELAQLNEKDNKTPITKENQSPKTDSMEKVKDVSR